MIATAVQMRLENNETELYNYEAEQLISNAHYIENETKDF